MVKAVGFPVLVDTLPPARGELEGGEVAPTPNNPPSLA